MPLLPWIYGLGVLVSLCIWGFVCCRSKLVNLGLLIAFSLCWPVVLAFIVAELTRPE